MYDTNLIPTSKRSKEEVRAIGRKGGRASGRARKEKRLLREALLAGLTAKIKVDGKTCQYMDQVAASIINEAIGGKNVVGAFNSIRDTIGEKPTEKTETNVSGDFVFSWAPKRKTKTKE